MVHQLYFLFFFIHFFHLIILIFLSKHKILKIKEFQLKYLKFLEFKIFQNFKFLHPNTLLRFFSSSSFFANVYLNEIGASVHVFIVVIRTTPDSVSVSGLTSAGFMGRKKRETAGFVPTHQHLVADVLLPHRSVCFLHCISTLFCSFPL